MSDNPFSIAKLWDCDAQGLNDSVTEGLIDPRPVSGDAWFRAQAHAARADKAWIHHKGSGAELVDLADYPDLSKEREAYKQHVAEEVPC